MLSVRFSQFPSRRLSILPRWFNAGAVPAPNAVYRDAVVCSQISAAFRAQRVRCVFCRRTPRAQQVGGTINTHSPLRYSVWCAEGRVNWRSQRRFSVRNRQPATPAVSVFALSQLCLQRTYRCCAHTCACISRSVASAACTCTRGAACWGPSGGAERVRRRQFIVWKRGGQGAFQRYVLG